MPRSAAWRTAASRSAASCCPDPPQPLPPTAQAPNPSMGWEPVKRGRGPKFIRAPAYMPPLRLGVAGGLQLARLDDFGTMTAGHQFLRFNDLHTTSNWNNGGGITRLAIMPRPPQRFPPPPPLQMGMVAWTRKTPHPPEPDGSDAH